MSVRKFNFKFEQYFKYHHFVWRFNIRLKFKCKNVNKTKTFLTLQYMFQIRKYIYIYHTQKTLSKHLM